jgi:hypothetical protein
MEEQVIDIDGQVLTKITDIHNEIVYRNTKGDWHRIGGPAVIRQNGYQFYYVDDIQYTKEQYPKAVLEYNLKQLVG